MFIFYGEKNLNFGSVLQMHTDKNGNKTQICTLNKSVDNSLSTALAPPSVSYCHQATNAGRQTNLMRNNVPCFLMTLLPADAWCNTASVHSLLCTGRMSHSAVCWTPFSAEINCGGLIHGSKKVLPAGR